MTTNPTTNAFLANNDHGLSKAECQIMDNAYAEGRSLKDIMGDLKRAALAQDLEDMPQDAAGKERWWQRWEATTQEAYGAYMGTWETFPLHMAAGRGREDILAQELAAGRHDINAVDDDRRTALHCAAAGGSSETLDLLLAHGADIHARSKFEATPLHDAAWVGNTQGCDKLLAAGAPMEAQDRFGRTPLHLAAEAGRASTYQALVGRGAQESALTNQGETAMQLASASMKAALKEQGEGLAMGM